MVRTTILKREYAPFENIGDNIYKIMFNKEDVVEIIHDDLGENIIEQNETDYCIVTMEIFYYKPSVDYVSKLLIDNSFIVDMTEAKIILSNLTSDITKYIRNIMLHNIKQYDYSIAVNQFFINNKALWLSKSDRVGLQMRFQAEKSIGKVETTLWFNDGDKITLNIDSALDMLYSLEEYASKCYDTTMEHIYNVGIISTFDEIIQYDYKKGYPQKLSF